MRASVTSSVGTPGSTRGHWAIRLPLALLELVVAGGAIYGGLEMVRHPITPLGVTPSLLAGSPFTTFTWPGLLLFLLIGIAPFLLAFGVLCKLTGAVLLSAGFGAGLMAWIAVQWVLLEARLWLQPLMFGIGAVVLILALAGFRRGER